MAAALRIPSVNQLVGFAVTMLIVLFILRFMPEGVRTLFRI